MRGAPLRAAAVRRKDRRFTGTPFAGGSEMVPVSCKGLLDKSSRLAASRESELASSRHRAMAHVPVDCDGSLAAGEASNDLYFALAVGGAVGMEDVVEPDGGLLGDVGALP